MTKPTPGPWQTIDGAEIAPCAGPSAHVELCRIVGIRKGESSWYMPDEARANARLIAAAPEMAEALAAILKHAGWPEPEKVAVHGDTPLCVAIGQARAALRKAGILED
mgnify:FL=1